MRVISEIELHKNLVLVLDSMVDGRGPLIIARDCGKPAAVLMSFEAFTSWEETLHLLRSPANAARLIETIRVLD